MICERRYDEGLRTFKDETIGAIRTIEAGGGKRVIDDKNDTQQYRIRKLTPYECWTLMGFSEEDFHSALRTLPRRGFLRGGESRPDQVARREHAHGTGLCRA